MSYGGVIGALKCSIYGDFTKLGCLPQKLLKYGTILEKRSNPMERTFLKSFYFYYCKVGIKSFQKMCITFKYTCTTCLLRLVEGRQCCQKQSCHENKAVFKKSNTHPKKMLKLNPHMETFQIYFGRSPCKDFTLRLKLCKCLIFVTPHIVTMSLSRGLSPLVILRWPK